MLPENYDTCKSARTCALINAAIFSRYYHVILFFIYSVAEFSLLSCSLTICFLVCLVCFIKIHRIVHRHQLQIHVQQQALENSTDTNKQQIRQSTKSANSIFIYFLVMILCNTPSFFVHIISAINNLNSIILWTYPVTVVFLISSIKPFLYCWLIPELRTAVF